MKFTLIMMTIANANGVTSISTAEFNGKDSCESAKKVFIQEFQSSYGQRAAPDTKAICVPKA